MTTIHRSASFINPASVNHISPALLRRLLDAYRGSVEPFGVFTRDGVDRDAVASMFLGSLAALPTPLANALCDIDQLGRSGQFGMLLALAQEHGVRVPDRPSASDLVVLMHLDAPHLIPLAHAHRFLETRRSYSIFFPLLPLSKGRPSIPAPDLSRIKSDAEDMANAGKRAGGVRVEYIATDGGMRLVVMSGDHARRDVSVDPDTGERVPVVFHSELYDAIVFDSATGELRIHARHASMVPEYQRIFGHRVLGDPLAYVPDGVPRVFTMDPIIDRSRECLVCHDVPGIERVELQEFTWELPSGALSGVWRCPDVFAELDECSLLAARSMAPCSCVLRFTFSDGRHGSAQILGHNRILVGRDSDMHLVGQFLEARGFKQNAKEANHGLTCSFLGASGARARRPRSAR